MAEKKQRNTRRESRSFQLPKFKEVLILSQMKEIQLFYFSAVNNNLEFDYDLITEDKYHHLNYQILVVTRQLAEFTSLKKANKNRILTN